MDENKRATGMETDESQNPTDGASNTIEALVPEPLTAEQIDDLKNQAAKAEENWQRLLRTAADLENFKKRAAREREEAILFANEMLFKKLIPVLDHFYMAMTADGNSPDEAAHALPTTVN